MDYQFLKNTQPKFIKTIDNSFKNNRLAQVYLFDGVKGTPKMLGAMYFANLILCEKHNFCGECIDCRRIKENVHPRIFMVSPGELDTVQSIKVEQIENLIEEFSYTGLEIGPRVFIINEIEKANPAAANKLLKFLEEMKEDSYGILITNDIDKVLETIKSRCQIVRFEKLGEQYLLKEYKEKNIKEEDARLLINLTNDISEGLSLVDSALYQELLEFSKKLFIELFTKKDLLIFSQENSKLLSDPQKDGKLFFDIFTQIVNDYLISYLLKTQKPIFVNLFEDIKKQTILENIITKEKAYEIIIKNLEYKRRLNSYVNKELLYIDYFVMLTKIREKKDK